MNLAPFRVKKQLAESFILCKLDYASTVFYPLPLCQQKRLQRVQNVCAGYVLGPYAREADCLQLVRAQKLLVTTVCIQSTIGRFQPRDPILLCSSHPPCWWTFLQTNMAALGTCSSADVVFSEYYIGLTGSAKARYREKVFTCGLILSLIHI